MTDTEQILIGRLLVKPEEIPTYAGQLSPSDFTDSRWAQVWSTMQRLASAGRSIDLLTLKAEGVDPGDPTRLLTSLHTADLGEYVSIIKRSAFKRNTTAALETLGRAIDRHTDPADIVNDIQVAVSDIVAARPGESQWKSIVDVSMDGFLAGGLPYGMPRLDALVQTAQPGDMITVAARANTGKTAFALSVAEGWARATNFPVLFASLEMSAQQIRRRFNQHVPEAEAYRYRNLVIDDKMATMSDVRTALAQLRLRYGGIGGITLDYIQRVTTKGEGATHEKVAAVSGACKDLAREFECPMLALSQLNRQSEIEKRKPRLSDLAQSGAIEQDSDLVFALWRADKTVPWVDVLSLKNRHGATDWEVRLDFHLDTMSVG